MSRSGYTVDCEHLGLYEATVKRTIRGRRGQAFLRELATELDVMPDRSLIAGDLIDADGNCCAIGVVCKSRGTPVDRVDAEDPGAVGGLVGISHSMAAEIAFRNAEDDDPWGHTAESREQRWLRMRAWVSSQIFD